VDAWGIATRITNSDTTRLDCHNPFSKCSPWRPTPTTASSYTLGLLERLRAECKGLWRASSEAYFRVDELLRELAIPNLHDIPTRLPFRVELWDRQDQNVRWVVAAASTVAIAHAALDTAIANFPDQRFTLRNGIHVIRAYPQEKRSGDTNEGTAPNAAPD
jgi:hypothetical protein